MELLLQYGVFFSFSFAGGDVTPKFYAPDSWKKKIG